MRKSFSAILSMRKSLSAILPTSLIHKSKKFSFDARLYDRFRKLSGWTVYIRFDCNGHIPVINERQQFTTIYLTNKKEFMKDLDEFKLNHIESCYYGEGIGFECIEIPGYMFNSYTYILGSMNNKGFKDYPLYVR